MRPLLSLVLLFICFTSQAQKPPMIPRVSFLAPKAGVEIGIHSVWSFYPALALNFNVLSQTLTYGSGASVTHTHISTILGLDLQGRHYYNVYKRIKQNKDVDKFAANFLCFRVKPGIVLNPYQQYVVVNSSGVPTYTTESTFAFWSSAAWGMQRNIGKYGYYSFMVGPGISLDTLTQQMAFAFAGGTSLEVGIKF
jgi:hypothetical protein